MAKRGNCYVTCEALYHLLGGKAAGWTPHYVKHNGDTHWYLVKHVWTAFPNIFYTKMILDPTAKQFKVKPDYSKGRGSGFLTKTPSKRAKELMKTLVWQEV